MILCRLDSSCISVCKMQLFTYLFVFGSVCVTALWKSQSQMSFHWLLLCCVHVNSGSGDGGNNNISYGLHYSCLTHTTILIWLALFLCLSLSQQALFLCLSLSQQACCCVYHCHNKPCCCVYHCHNKPVVVFITVTTSPVVVFITVTTSPVFVFITVTTSPVVVFITVMTSLLLCLSLSWLAQTLSLCLSPSWLAQTLLLCLSLPWLAQTLSLCLSLPWLAQTLLLCLSLPWLAQTLSLCLSLSWLAQTLLLCLSLSWLAQTLLLCLSPQTPLTLPACQKWQRWVETLSLCPGKNPSQMVAVASPATGSTSVSMARTTGLVSTPHPASLTSSTSPTSSRTGDMSSVCLLRMRPAPASLPWPPTVSRSRTPMVRISACLGVISRSTSLCCFWIACLGSLGIISRSTSLCCFWTACLGSLGIISRSTSLCCFWPVFIWLNEEEIGVLSCRCVLSLAAVPVSSSSFFLPLPFSLSLSLSSLPHSFPNPLRHFPVCSSPSLSSIFAIYWNVTILLTLLLIVAFLCDSGCGAGIHQWAAQGVSSGGQVCSLWVWGDWPAGTRNPMVSRPALVGLDTLPPLGGFLLHKHAFK